MAVIHISEEEAARNLPELLDKVSAGDRVEIGRGKRSFSLTASASRPFDSNLLSEVICRMRDANEPPVLLDDKFGDDLEEVIRSHSNEIGRNAWD